MHRLHDFMCPSCEYLEERLVDSGERLEIICPNCGEENLTKVYLKSPAFRIGGNNCDRQVASMQKSFRERFHKKERDDLLHKHGNDFNDSLRCGEIGRIKKKIHDKTN